MNRETIVAPATPLGTSALGVVRISGSHCRDIARELFGVSSPPPRKMIRTQWVGSKGEHWDDLMIAFFPGPASFTGEDVLEVFPHGNPLLIRNLIRTVGEREGCRLAEPGEFTRRAFENGKIDLTQAEGILVAIHARTEEALRLARRLSEGKLSRIVDQLTEQVISLSSRMEWEMDFAEEGSEPNCSGWTEQIEELRSTVRRLLDGWERVRKHLRIPRIVLWGAPNAGKSSLINALLGEERLLVSDRPGTTRDWVETSLYLESGEVTLCDTAGIGVPLDDLDREAQNRSRAVLDEAEIILKVEDGTAPPAGASSPAPIIPSQNSGVPSLTVRTRLDLPNYIIDESEGTIGVSCRDRRGIEAVRTQLNQLLRSRELPDDEVTVATERQAEALRRGDRLLSEAAELLRRGGRIVPETTAHLMRETRAVLEGITGAIAPQAVLEKIFSSFCVGK